MNRKKKNTTWNYLSRLGGYFGRDKKYFSSVIVLYLLSAVSVVFPPYIVQQILDVALPNQDKLYFVIACGLYLLALLADFITGFFSQYVMSVFGQRAMKALRSDLFCHVQRLPTYYFDRVPLGRIQTRLVNDVDALAEVFSTGAITLVSDLIIIFSIFAAMLYLNLKLALVALIILPLLMALSGYFQKFAKKAFRDVRLHLARMNGFLAEHIEGMQVVQVFGQEERTIHAFAECNEDDKNANFRAVKLDALLFSFVEAIGTFSVATVLAYGGYALGTTVIEAGTIVAFAQYIRRVFVPLRDVAAKYTMLQTAFVACERIFSLLDEPLDEAIEDKEDPPEVKIRQSISLKNINFGYTTREDAVHWVLHDVNLEFRAGESTALVGPTGSGKTSVLRLLNRFYLPQSGKIFLDEKELSEFNVHELRKKFALVLQDVHLFEGTVLENLRLHPQTRDEEIFQAVANLGLKDFIQRLPEGYQSKVQHHGNNFSVGERQLFALTRALVLNPEVLILDEATSNIDSETENLIQRALEVLLKDRTSIVVAHRLSTIKKASKIIVLKEGRVEQEGTHKTLVKQEGLYQKLIQSHYGVQESVYLV